MLRRHSNPQQMVITQKHKKLLPRCISNRQKEHCSRNPKSSRIILRHIDTVRSLCAANILTWRAMCVLFSPTYAHFETSDKVRRCGYKQNAFTHCSSLASCKAAVACSTCNTLETDPDRVLNTLKIEAPVLIFRSVIDFKSP